MTKQPTADIVRSTGERATFAIRDLSAGGARLVGSLPLFEDERVQVHIELDAPFTLAADVVHFDQQRSVANVEFRDVSAGVLAQIERAIAELLEQVRAEAPPTVLVVHPKLDVSSALERDLARIQTAARVCTSFTELVEYLDDRTVRYVAVIVAGELGADLGLIMQHLEDHHADLRRVALFGEQIEKIEHPAAGRVHAVLRTPWRFKGLARAVDVPMQSVVTTYDQLVALKMTIGESDDD